MWRLAARRLAREPLDDLVAQGVSLLAHGGADRRLQALRRSGEEPTRPCPVSRARDRHDVTPA